MMALFSALFILSILLSMKIDFVWAMDRQQDQGDQQNFNDYDGRHFVVEINQYLMYTIAKNRRKTGGENLTYDVIVQEILDESGQRDICLNERIVKCVRLKIKSLLDQGKIASRKGGKQLKQFTEKLKGAQAYQLVVYLSETDKAKLRADKHKLQQQLEESKSKYKKLEDELQQANASASYWKKRFKSIVKKQIKENKKRSRYATRPLSEYPERSQYRIKRKLKADCQSALDFLGLYDLVPCKVEYLDINEGTYRQLHLFDNEDLDLFLTDSENNHLEDTQLDNVNLLLYIKERFNISDKAWHELASISKGLPTKYSLKKRIAELNSKWEIFPTPGDAEGVQRRLTDSLTEQVARLCQKNVIQKDDVIKVKVTGDGTRIGKRLNILNVAFSIINEGSTAASEKGNYIIAIVKTKDDYDGIRDSLKDLVEEMGNLTSIKVNHTLFKVELFLGGDWKFLATVCGIGPANQDFACIWCLCPKLQRHDVSKDWPLLEGRTVGKIMEHVKGRKYNCRHTPLLNIELDHVIIDTLHLFLRISDVLIEYLILQLRREDLIEKKSFSNGFELKKYKHMERYSDLLKSIGIPFAWSINKDTKKLCYRELNGPEKLLLFQSIDVKCLLPSFPNAFKIQNLWNDFLAIYVKLRQDFTSEIQIAEFTNEVKIWTMDFTYLYEASSVTPYMHALRCHVPSFLQLYGNIAHFNQQGLEKYNDQASKDFFRSTNHKGEEALMQLMLKKNRVHYLQALGAERIRKSYFCGNCSEQGHSMKKCTNRCNDCGHTTCCAHLTKKDGKWIKNCSLLTT